MRRQGKYTKRVTTKQKVKRHYNRWFRWWQKMSWRQRMMFVAGSGMAVLVVIPLLTYAYFARDISDMDRLMNRNNTGVVIYANDGKTELYSMGRAAHRKIVPLDQISEPMKQAVVASEDKDFYRHKGFSILSTLRAVYGYVVNRGGSFGGSTITQQLAKITLLSENRSFLRQFQAFSVAVAIENTYTKEQILDMYLNSVYFGENAFGIEDAAEVYFGTTPDKLDLAQSAMLVGVLPAPSVYSPVSGSPEYAKERQATVLSRMVTNKYITSDEKDAAAAVELAYQEPKATLNNSKSPHFTQMVLDELYKRYGEEAVNRSGYQVLTTLDMNMQDSLVTAIQANMSTINRNGGTNAAGVAIDPTNGEIRALVGSYDWNDENFGKVNVITSARQPGSSYKPIYYAHALADGVITPATVFADEKTDFGGGYVPLNADRKFHGNVTVRTALDWSLNIPSVMVMRKYGIDKTVEMSRNMGLTTIDPKKNDYGLSLALGSAEVTPLAMTNAYAAFANGGNQYQPTIMREIKNKFDKDIFKSDQKAKRVISEQGAFLISNILADNNARAGIFGNTLTVYDAKTGGVKQVAVKTGTTNDSRDAWTVGYTPNLALGVWVGNNDNTAMLNGGSIMAGPIFTKAMGAILAGDETRFVMPQGVTQRNICTSNHGLADRAVKDKTYVEYFLDTALPSVRCLVSEPAPTPSVTPEPDNDNSDETDTVVMTLTASPSSPAAAGELVTFTVTLSSGTQGSIQFRDNGNAMGTQPISDGTASISSSLLTVGSHAISAIYVPADSSTQSKSVTITFIVE